MTYDQLLAQGERLLEMLDAEGDEQVDDLHEGLETWDDDLPF